MEIDDLKYLGWIEDFESESTETVSKAYIRRGDHNIGECEECGNIEQSPLIRLKLFCNTF